MDANDLYAGLQLPAARAAGKRPSGEARAGGGDAPSRSSEDAAAAKAANAEEQRPAKRQRVVELPETVDKLKRYMVRELCSLACLWMDAAMMYASVLTVAVGCSWWTRSSPRRASCSRS
jgi:hypothetical protein